MSELPRKKAVVLCDGRRPEKSVLEAFIGEAALFVAADGGGNVARKMGLKPDAVIGDLDSYQKTGTEEFEVIHSPGQETNDLEKALDFILKEESTDVAVFGAVGKRVDHTLKNLSVLSRFHPQFKSLVYKDRYGDIFLLPKNFSAEYPVGTPISLYPLNGRVSGITISGLKYPLMEESLEHGVRDGTSNETTEPEVEITYKTGELLMVVSGV